MKRPPCCSNTRLTWTGHTISTGLCRPQSETQSLKQCPYSRGYVHSVQSPFLCYTLVPRLLYTAWGLPTLQYNITQCKGRKSHDIRMMYCKEWYTKNNPCRPSQPCVTRPSPLGESRPISSSIPGCVWCTTVCDITMMYCKER